MLEISSFRGCKLVTVDKLRAFIDVEFGGALVVKGFKIIDGKNGLFVGAPSRKLKGKDGEPDTWNDVVYFTKESNVGAGIHEQILAHYKENVVAQNSPEI